MYVVSEFSLDNKTYSTCDIWVLYIDYEIFHDMYNIV